MYKTTLVEADIADGQRVVEGVEKILQIAAAFWIYLEEEDEWKLVVVSPDVPEKGPFELYTNIAVLLNDLSTDQQKPVQMPLTRITLVSPNSLLYERVKHFSGLLDMHIYKRWAS
jgi:hypothetical protein